MCQEVPWYRLFVAAEFEPDVPGFGRHLIELGLQCPGIEGIVQDLGIEVGEAGAGWGEGQNREEGAVNGIVVKRIDQWGIGRSWWLMRRAQAVG